MAVQKLIRSVLPVSMLPAARAVYRGLQVPRYYIPYILRNGQTNPPSSLTLDLTYRCNLGCAMCPIQIAKKDAARKRSYERDGATEMSLSEIRALIGSAAQMGIRAFTITGGEPFLRPDLVDIIRCVKSNGMDCSVLSNGTLIDAKMATALVAVKLDSLSLSLDGLETTHNAIRGRKDAYARTIAAVRHLNEARQRLRTELPLVTLGCTILSSNAAELTDLVTLARDLGLPLAFGYLHYTTAQMLRDTRRYIEIEEVKKENQDVPLQLRNVSWEALANEVERAKEAAQALGVAVSFTPDLKGREIQSRFADDDHHLADKCFYPWYSTRVNPYGVVYPCSMNIVMGNVREKMLMEIWNGEPYARFRRTLRAHRLFPKCAKCYALNNRMWNYLPPSRINAPRVPSRWPLTPSRR